MQGLILKYFVLDDRFHILFSLNMFASDPTPVSNYLTFKAILKDKSHSELIVIYFVCFVTTTTEYILF